MKKLTKINLLNLSQTEMAKREEKLLYGGACACGCLTSCGCKYAGEKEGPDDSYYGGSSSDVSGDTNLGHTSESARRNAGYIN